MRCGTIWRDDEWFAQLWEAYRLGARLAPGNHGALDNLEGHLRKALESGLIVNLIDRSMVQRDERDEVKPREDPVPPTQKPPGELFGGGLPSFPHEPNGRRSTGG